MIFILYGHKRLCHGPYGGLADRAAVCLGYAAAFQPLMDMSGVECVTIVGAVLNSTGDHAWGYANTPEATAEDRGGAA